jgi:regulation of enolase protein 1 (concanavalin A-like superfamily)
MSSEIQSYNAEWLIKLPGINFTRSLNVEERNFHLQGNIIKLKSDAKTDFFNSPDGHYFSNAPLLLTKIDNSQSFTFRSKVTPEFKEKYDAGAIYIYSDNNLWQKFAFERDDRGSNRIVSVRTKETSDDCNHQSITGSSVYLKISSDTQTIAFYYSMDGIQWDLVRLYKNNYPSILWLGISSQSPLGQGNQSIFENPSLVAESVKDFRLGI